MEKKNNVMREGIAYLIFGVLTTLVGWITYFLILLSGKTIFDIQSDETTGAAYVAVYTVAQIIQWIAAVLFAFFTNRKYVFEANEPSVSTARQLSVFAGGRVATFLVDYLVTLFGTLALSSLLPSLNDVVFFGKAWNINEISAKFVAAVIVVIANYFFSKFLVFRKNK